MLRLHGVEIISACAATPACHFTMPWRACPMACATFLRATNAPQLTWRTAYARVSGKVGVCEGPSGGGVTYIIPGLAEANESSVPLLCINSDISVAARGRYTLTELDVGALMSPLTKWHSVLDRSEELPNAFREAFKQITTGRPAAAHISLPFDVQNGSVARSDVWGDLKYARYPGERAAPAVDIVERAARLLREAANPVFICGGGAVISAAQKELLDLAERLSAPVATTISGKGTIDEEHSLAVGVVGSNGGTLETRAIVDEADLIVFVGCRAGSVTTERWRHPVAGNCKIIHIEVDPKVPGTNYPADVALVGDAKMR
jgi:acetolactate synthase-1/2/3 large subunit